MKTTLALAFLAAVALQALGAPTLKEGVAPWEAITETGDREKKSNYVQGHQTPCAAAAAGHVGGYGAGVGISSFGHGGIAAPAVHTSQFGHGGLGGYGLRPALPYGFGPQYYRGVEEQDAVQQAASENHDEVLASQAHIDSDNAALSEMSSDQATARSYGGGYGSGLAVGSGYGSGLAIGSGYGSGLAYGGFSQGVGPLGGPAVGLFPNSGLGGCGAIPLLLSCSPSLVRGHLVQAPHQHAAYAAGGYGYGGGAFVAPGHSVYRDGGDASGALPAQQQTAVQKPTGAAAAQQSAQQGAQQSATVLSKGGKARVA